MVFFFYLLSQDTNTPNPTQQSMSSKLHLVESVQKALGKDVSKAHSEKVVAAVIDSIKSLVKKHKSLQLIGFGTFKVVNRKARKGINPKTGKAIQIKASKSVRLTPGKAFKQSL
jgi:DNA-binding protein HU-beta